MEPLSLAPEPVQQELLSIDTGSVPPYLDPKTAYQRASKATYGLSYAVPKTTDEVYSQISNGREKDYREEASAAVDAVNKKKIVDSAPTSSIEQIANSLTFSSPSTVLEQAYSRQFLKPLTDTSSRFIASTSMAQAMEEMPKQTTDTLASGDALTTKGEIARTKLQNIEAEYQDQSWGGWTVDQLKDVVSLGMYRQVKLRGQADVGFFEELGLGSNLAEQVKSLYRLPPNEFETKLGQIIDTLKADNPSLALKFAHAVVGMSTEDKLLDDIFTALDVGTIGAPIGSALAKKALTFNTMRRAVKDSVKAAGNVSETVSPKVAAADGAGDLGKAATSKSAEYIAKDLAGSADPIQKGIDTLPSIFQFGLDHAKTNLGRFGQELGDRLDRATEATRADFLGKVSEVIRVNRMPVIEAVETVMQGYKQEIRDGYKGTLKNAILDVGDATLNKELNTYHIPVMFGRPDGELFPSEAAAHWARVWNGFPDAEIAQKGAGWYYTVNKPVQETSDYLRDLILETTVDTGRAGITFTRGVREGLRGLWQAGIGWVRYPAEVLSKQESAQRNIATFVKSELTGVVAENSKVFSDIPRKYIKDFETTLDAGRHLIDPATKKPGYWFQTPGEIETFYQQRFNRLPEKSEIEGYFAAVRNYEMDLYFRRILMYTAKARQGAESHVVFGVDKAGNMVRSDAFDGVLMKEWPGPKHGMLVVRDEIGSEWYGRTGNMTESTQQELKDAFNTGKLKVIQVYDPDVRPLNGFGRLTNERVVYVVAPNVEHKQLDLASMLPRRGGGHFDYDYDFYLKQPTITKDAAGVVYSGDKTFMALPNGVLGQDMRKELHTIRDMIKNGDFSGARAHAGRVLPNMDADQHIKDYFPSTGTGGKATLPRLNLFEDFEVVPRGKAIADMPGMTDKWKKTYPDFVDGTREGSLAKQSIIEYTGERDVHDLYTVDNKGTRQNPVYSYEPAKFVDPFTTMNRAMNNVINSMFMNDYKFYSMEHWLAEASGKLKASQEEIRHAPWYHFQNPDFKKGVPVQDRLQLENMHRAIKAFTGMPSDVENFMHSANQAILDAEYSGSKLARITPGWLLPGLTDAPRFIRSIAAHPTLGLFNIPSFFTQASSITNVAAISPTHAPRAAVGTLMHAWTSVNSSPAVIAGLDAKATAMGWKPGVWAEGREWLLRSGFDNVAGEHANLDNPMATKFIGSGPTDKILEWGMVPFVKGSKVTRRDAWYTAWSEFRTANPFGAPSRTDIENVLARASVLDINMSRANNSIWNTGVFSVANTFYTYSKNLAEVMTGTQISPMAKARMLGISSVMYGVPVGTVGLYGIPAVDYIRKQVQAQTGYVPGADTVSTVLMDGLPAAIGAYVSGTGDIQKGNVYNFSKYGSKGEEPINQALGTDKTMFEILSGAGGSKLRGFAKDLHPFMDWAVSHISGDRQYKINLDSYLDVVRNINSINAGYRWYTAVNTGRWISKNEVPIDDVSKLNATFMSLTGLTDVKYSDTKLKSDRGKEEVKFFTDAAQLFQKHFARATEAVKNNDTQTADEHYSNAFYVLEAAGLAPTQKQKAMGMAMDLNRNLIDKIDMKYYTEDVPEAQQQTRMKAYETIQQMKLKRDK